MATPSKATPNHQATSSSLEILSKTVQISKIVDTASKVVTSPPKDTTPSQDGTVSPKVTRGSPFKVMATFVVLLLVAVAVRAEDPTEQMVNDEINRIDHLDKSDSMSALRKVMDTLVSVAVSGVGSTNEIFKNTTLYGDNELWRDLLTECAEEQSMTCVKKNVFNYLERTVSSMGDVHVTDSLVFQSNGRVVENKYGRVLNEPLGPEEALEESLEDSAEETEARGRSITTFQGIADVLYDKGSRFLQIHDLTLQLPEYVLDGAVIRLSPRALGEEGGALLTVEPAGVKDDAQGRILFHKHKKMFRRRLLLSLFALLLVIKLIKVAVLFVLPVLLGVGTAKKIVLKVLLFLFPALAHLFKFCSYYHGLHAQKYHHHHHQNLFHHYHRLPHLYNKHRRSSEIAHHHHHVPVHVPVPVHVHHDDHHHEESAPPPYHATAPSHFSQSGPPGQFSHSGPPGWGHDYTARNEFVSAAQHNENELASWGIGGGPGGVARDTFGIADNSIGSHSLAYSGYLDEQRYSRSAQPATEAAKVVPAASKSSVAASGFRPSPKASVAGPAAGAVDQAALLRAQQQLLLRQQQLQHLALQQQQHQKLRIQVVTPTTAVPGTTVQVTYDPFYSPILQRMDNVFVQLGFNEEACRERLVCSMYKNPPRFSPHSNLLSAELSRDASELQKPDRPNSASARFHRYVQSARDGQDQKDCLRLYPACTVNTEL